MADDLPYMDDNIIDLSLLLSSSPTVAAEELNKLRTYLSSWGCFQLVNHGMSLEFLDEVRDICKTFFRLPSEAKEHCAKTPDNSQGYGTDYMPENGNPSSYRLLLTIHPEDQRHPDRWPNTPSNFRDLMWEYTLKAKTVHDQVVQAMAKSLNLEENSFLDGYGENYQIAARINYYPPFPFADLIRQVSKHADISATTLLLVDKKVEALELEKDGDWFKVPIIPEAIMIIVGDQVEIMSNGIFKSAEHRQNPSPVKDRMSWAMFFSPDLEKEIAPLKELVTEDRPAMYKPITRYIDLFEKYYPRGIRPITAVKL